MTNSASKPNMVELMEREFDLRLRMEQLSLDGEHAEEQVKVARLYAQAKADLDEARKALLISA